ncbi:multidrug resistance protein [Colletotrichum truncatum]|uniref:Multidrug resistance protein n=1 Tax=Colletotrichum truncatum TaxID=5467 RepID=A0ACC3YU58_COLTU|nr:multidrug resistance protein [Colletotrichum truncatum]KAF6798684.1 multidrug resistance protein [Colletotrichum truncatum]
MDKVTQNQALDAPVKETKKVDGDAPDRGGYWVRPRKGSQDNTPFHRNIADSTFHLEQRIFKYGSSTDYILEAVAIIAAIGSGVAVALINLVIGQFINVLSGATGAQPNLGPAYMAQVSKFSLYFVYIGIARFGLTYIYSTLMTLVAFNLTRNIRHQYFRAALSQEIGFFDQALGGSISAQAVANGKFIQAGAGEKLGQVFQAIATFIGAFIIAFVTQWKLTLILICIVPALLIVIGSMSVLDYKSEIKIIKNNAQTDAYSESLLGSIRTIQAFNLRPRLLREYASYTQKTFDLSKSKNWLYGIMFGGEYFIIFAGMGLAFWQGVAMISRGEVAGFGTVFTVLFSVIISASSINALAPHLVSFGRASTAANELFALIDRESEINPFSSSGNKPTSITGTIDFSSVGFAYPTRPKNPVLQDFSLTMPAGKVTALVGPSGSGKSTVVGLLERWYNPLSGSIKLDGVDIKDLNLLWLRTNIRLVQQEPVLFNGTVFENIVYGLVGTEWESAPRVKQLELVKQAAVTAFADDFIRQLPRGYDTPIGERGGLLSGGQKQRVAIARSIISNPKILLLDEATSALDPHAEGIVQQALDSASRNRTTIVIAHKLKTIRNADNIVVLARGKIIEQGTHEQLMAEASTYSALVKVQDLSPTVHDDSSQQSQEDEVVEQIEKTKSLAKYTTMEANHLASLKDREDFDAYKKTSLARTLVKVILASWDLRWWYLLIATTCTVGAASYPGQAFLLAGVMDLFTAPDMVPRGNFISLMFFVMSLGCLVVYFILGWSTNVIAQSLNQRFRDSIFDSLLRQDLRFYDRSENTVGAMNSRLSSYPAAIQELMGFTIAIILMAVINLVASSIISIVIAWKLGLVGVFAAVPPMLIAGWTQLRLETKMDSDIDKRFSHSASIASESIMAIRTVSSLALERKLLDKYVNELDHAIAGSRRPTLFMRVWFALTQAIEHFVLALGFWWGSVLLSRGEVSFYQFIVSFMGLFYSGQAAGQFFSFASSFTKANHAANYYFWITSLQPTVRQTDENKDRAPRTGCSSYDFKDVKFSYPLAPDNRVLKGTDLKIEPGQFVAFVGASGCGKSTMISLLQRYYDPTSGQIIIDEQDDLKDLNPWLYRSNIALVQQEPTMFPASIRANVSMGKDFDLTKSAPTKGLPTADDAELERALRAANAWDFVSSLPDGLDTPCGTTGGSQLSGGQRQRIAIARALIRDPNVLLLDEATSALDTDSERIVQAALMEAAGSSKRITIAVAHRLSTVRQANRIFVFYEGHIAEAGSHDELIRQGGMYSKMCEAQSIEGA